MEKRNFIVTGGAGYIGGYLVDSLVEEGNTISIDNLASGKHVNKKALAIKCDLRNEEAINSLNLPSESVIFHLAANPNVKESMTRITEHYGNDVTATLNALELARRIDSEKIVFASTSAVYGDAERPTPENAQLKPISNYGLFKSIGEEMVNFYSENYGINSCILRFANVVGGRASHGIIPDFIRKLEKERSRLEILGDGRQRKSYIYIKDVIKALLLAAQKRGLAETFNVGNVDTVSVEEIAGIIEGAMSLKPKHYYVDKYNGRGWPGDVKEMLLDIRKISKLGWKPSMNSSDAILKATEDLLTKI